MSILAIMAAVAITNPVIVVELKYSDQAMATIIDNVSALFHIQAANRAASRANVISVLFRWLKSAGSATSLGDGTTLTVTIAGTQRTITATQMKGLITATIPTGTLRGFAKQLSILCAAEIQADIQYITNNPATLHTAANLNFPGANLYRRLAAKVNTEVNRYYLSDAMDITLVPEVIRVVLEEHAKTRAARR